MPVKKSSGWTECTAAWNTSCKPFPAYCAGCIGSARQLLSSDDNTFFRIADRCFDLRMKAIRLSTSPMCLIVSQRFGNHPIRVGETVPEPFRAFDRCTCTLIGVISGDPSLALKQPRREALVGGFFLRKSPNLPHPASNQSSTARNHNRFITLISNFAPPIYPECRCNRYQMIFLISGFALRPPRQVTETSLRVLVRILHLFG